MLVVHCQAARRCGPPPPVGARVWSSWSGRRARYAAGQAARRACRSAVGSRACRARFVPRGVCEGRNQRGQGENGPARSPLARRSSTSGRREGQHEQGAVPLLRGRCKTPTLQSHLDASTAATVQHLGQGRGTSWPCVRGSPSGGSAVGPFAGGARRQRRPALGRWRPPRPPHGPLHQGSGDATRPEAWQGGHARRQPHRRCGRGRAVLEGPPQGLGLGSLAWPEASACTSG